MFEISSAVPAEIAELANDRGIQEYSAEDLKDARQEIEEELAAGKRIGQLDLEAILDEELDKNYGATLRSLYEHLAGIGNDGSSDAYDRNMNAAEWMLALVRRHITDEMVEERAEKIAADRLEDA